MKKALSALAIAMCCIFTANAQIQRGHVLVGSDISDFNLSLNKGGAFTMRIDPKAAWFIGNGTALGAYLKFTLETAKGAGTYTTYGVGALARQYLNRDPLNAVKHVRAFLEGNVGIEGDNNSFNGVKTSTNGLGLGIGPGLAYFITPNVGLEGLLKYDGLLGFGTAVTTSKLDFGLGFQIYLSSRTVRNAISNTQ
jgi:hypothetical protein